MKDIKDYLHLYVGSARVEYDSSYMRDLTPSEYNIARHVADNVKLVLRPLSDMTDEEDKEIGRITREVLHRKGPVYIDESIGAKVRYMLSIGFDLFGLIDAGLAIDATKLSNP